MMIYDCFIFFNELDLLEMRFNILKNHVDRFVLVEADRTFTNKPKRLIFEEHKNRFKEFLDRVAHITVHDMPEGDDPWQRENFQRQCISRGLNGCREDDLILVSDVDEIPNPLLLERLSNLKPGTIAWLEQRFFYYFLNVEQPVKWCGTGLARFADFQDPCEIRKGKQPSIIIKGDTGWHFSYLGNVKQIRKKIQAFSHREFDTPDILEHLEERTDNLMCIFGGHEAPFQIVEMDESFPKYILENQKKYKKYIKN